MARHVQVNISAVERVARVLIGLHGVVVGLVLLTAAPTAAAGVLEALLVPLGLALVVTGARGHCPLYAKFGRLPRSLRRAS